MDIKTKDDWIALAKQTIPLLGAYMAEHRGQADPAMIEAELNTLFEAKNWIRLHERFIQLWTWLPESQSIRHQPFFDLCDLCSEAWVLEEAQEA